MKRRTSLGFIAIFMALLFFLSMKIQFEHSKNQIRYFESGETEDEWRNNLMGLPRGIVRSVSDMEPRPLWGNSRSKGNNENFTALLAMAVGISQKQNVDLIVSKFLKANCSIILFHYDGKVDEWRDLQWSDRAIHILAHNQTKWWFAKRFLHPDVLSIYDYIFLWDEDLGVENFHTGRSTITNSPIDNLSTESVINVLTADTSPPLSENGSGIKVRNTTEMHSSNSNNDEAQRSDNLGEFSDSFVHWVINGETLCY